MRTVVVDPHQEWWTFASLVTTMFVWFSMVAISCMLLALVISIVKWIFWVNPTKHKHRRKKRLVRRPGTSRGMSRTQTTKKTVDLKDHPKYGDTSTPWFGRKKHTSGSLSEPTPRTHITSFQSDEFKSLQETDGSDGSGSDYDSYSDSGSDYSDNNGVEDTTMAERASNTVGKLIVYPFAVLQRSLRMNHEKRD